MRLPVSVATAEGNRRHTERLRRLVSRLDAAMLDKRLPDGWIMAGTLAAVAVE